MTKLDITKSSNEDIDNLYNSVVDLEVNKIINQDGFPTKESIIEYNQTGLNDISIDIDDLVFPVNYFDLEDLPDDIPIGKGKDFIAKNSSDIKKRAEFYNRLFSVPDDVLAKIEEMWVSKELPMLSEDKISYIVYQADTNHIDLVDASHIDLVDAVDLLKHVLK